MYGSKSGYLLGKLFEDFTRKRGGLQLASGAQKTAYTYMYPEVTKWLESQDAVEFCQEIISLIHQLNPAYPPVVPEIWLERAGQIGAASIDDEGWFTIAPVQIARIVWLEMHGELWQFIKDDWQM